MTKEAISLENPLAQVFELESRSMRTGLLIGLAGALLVHVAGASEAARLANGLGNWALDTRTAIHSYFSRLYEIELTTAPPPPPPPEPPPAPEPEAAKPLPLPAPPKAAREHEAPPAPAQAGKILAQEPNPDEPVDLTGQGFVTGNAETYAGGVTASNGTSTTAVRNLRPAIGGVPGSTGKDPGPAVSGPDLSRAASVTGGTNWDCPFPPEADTEQIDFQRVQIVVTVGADGSAQNIKLVTDPGHGFGRAALRCAAMGRKFEPARDRQGRAVLSTLPMIVRFQR